jgi:hypothetical protein
MGLKDPKVHKHFHESTVQYCSDKKHVEACCSACVCVAVTAICDIELETTFCTQPSNSELSILHLICSEGKILAKGAFFTYFPDVPYWIVAVLTSDASIPNKPKYLWRHLAKCNVVTNSLKAHAISVCKEHGYIKTKASSCITTPAASHHISNPSITQQSSVSSLTFDTNTAISRQVLQ